MRKHSDSGSEKYVYAYVRVPVFDVDKLESAISVCLDFVPTANSNNKKNNNYGNCISWVAAFAMIQS